MLLVKENKNLKNIVLNFLKQIKSQKHYFENYLEIPLVRVYTF